MNCDYSQKFPKVHLESIGFWFLLFFRGMPGGIWSLQVDFFKKTRNQPVSCQSIDHASFPLLGGKHQWHRPGIGLFQGT
jgi:hypothetical protein